MTILTIRPDQLNAISSKWVRDVAGAVNVGDKIQISYSHRGKRRGDRYNWIVSSHEDGILDEFATWREACKFARTKA